MNLPASQTSRGAGQSKSRGTRPQARTHVGSQPLVQANFRVPPNLLRALMYAATQRKVERLYPTSQQDIMAVALAEWLKRNGYEVEEE